MRYSREIQKHLVLEFVCFVLKPERRKVESRKGPVYALLAGEGGVLQIVRVVVTILTVVRSVT